MNVDALLRSLTVKQFEEWRAYAELEPFDERRDDYRTASIVTMIANVNRDTKKHKKPFKLKDFLLKFEQEEKPKQTSDDHFRILMQIAAAHAEPEGT